MKRFLGFLLFVPAVSFADQCAWVEKDQGREAVHYASVGLKYVDYCEPCGDAPGKLRVGTIEKVEMKEAADGVNYEVMINGEAKDVAYVFVETVAGSGNFENLAAYAKCKTDGVSKTINVEKPVQKPSIKKPPVKKTPR